MKYLKKFENNTDYETYIEGSDAIRPNVSLVGQDEVHYNPYLSLIARALKKLADLGYTEPFEGIGKIFINVNREGYTDYALTLAAYAHKADDQDDYAICLFGTQLEDAFAMLQVEMGDSDPDSPYYVVTSADWQFFQGATVDTLESDGNIVAFVDPGDDLTIFEGEEGIEI